MYQNDNVDLDDADEVDVDAVVRDISEMLTGIGVPQLVATVVRWLCRLTAEGRGPNELYHLRLLRFMMVNGRVGPPFLRDPPAGHLLPLHAYLRPRCRAGGLRSQTRVVDDCNRNEAKGRAPDDDEDDDSSGVKSVVVYDRRGHLASGGSSCWGPPRPDRIVKAASVESTANPYGKLCDPCLDDLGTHLKPTRPGPLDVAYRDMLGECAIPRITEAERQTVDPALLRVLEDVNEATTLQEFYFQVAMYTCDQASLMMRVSDGMVDDFNKFVLDVFDSRVEHIGEGLAAEQTSSRDKYAWLRDRALNRATEVLRYLRKAMPMFSWSKYQEEPDVHLRREILRRAPAGDDGDGDDVSDYEDGDESRDGGPMRVARKKELYTLNRLRADETRIECDYRQLVEQRTGLNQELAVLGARLSEVQSRLAADMKRQKDELTVLQKQSAEQKDDIARMTEAIRLAMRDVDSRPNDC